MGIGYLNEAGKGDRVREAFGITDAQLLASLLLVALVGALALGSRITRREADGAQRLETIRPGLDLGAARTARALRLARDAHVARGPARSTSR